MRASVDTWRMIRSHWRIIAMASFVLLALFCVVVFILPNLMAPASDFSTAEDRLATQNDIRGTLVQAVVGIAILGGAAATAFFSARTISLNREGQITDRFTQATVQLGDEQLAVRLGGIYALERIARDSTQDHWSIMEVLSAFVRRRPSEVDMDRDGALKDRSADVQAAIRVIGRRSDIEGEPDRLDLWRADLRWLDMRDVRLARANLEEASLERAGLRDASLQEAILRKADLKSARLHRARLDRADLSEADVRGAVLEGPEWIGDIEDGAHLEHAVLVRTDLRGANLPYSHFERANLTDADMTGAVLTHAYFQGTDLTGARLDGADLSESVADAETRWPKGFAPIKRGVRPAVDPKAMQAD